MKIVGYTVGPHDLGIGVIENNKIQYATNAERFVRKKHAYAMPDVFRTFIDSNTTVTISNLDRIYTRAGHVSDLFSANFTRYDHHTSHAASAFYTRPWETYDDTVIMVIDGTNDAISRTKDITLKKSVGIFKYNGSKIVTLDSQFIGICKVYAIISRLLGFDSFEEGSTMGLSSFGKVEEKYLDILEKMLGHEYLRGIERSTIHPMIWHSENFGFKKPIRLKKNYGIKNFQKINAVFEKQHGDHWKENFAASVQKFAEDKMLEYAAIARQHGSKLCFAGGGAQNIIINTKLKEMFDDIWIVPDPTDGGLGLGCALGVWGEKTGRDRIEFNDAYLGYNIKGDIHPKEVVNYLLQHKVCGIANGRAEWGPRALGNRSLIGDIRYDIKDTVNKIKKRPPFRPFGPLILEEEFDKWFEGHSNGYMQFVCKPKHNYQSVIHVDGTSRVQTVPKNSVSIIRPILEEYFQRTGIPMLLNTSLNIRGEPMVNDENHAAEFERKYGVKVFR